MFYKRILVYLCPMINLNINLTSLGNPTHAGFITELYSGTLCGATLNKKHFRTDSPVTCPDCAKMLESEKYPVLKPSSELERIVYGID